MIAIGFIIIWTGYSAALWGYCLIRGYDITVKQLMSTTWPPPAKA